MTFKKFQSLDFQEYRSKIYETHEVMQKKRHPMKTETLLWFIFAIIGVLVGFISFLLALAEDYLTEVKIWVTQHFMQLNHTEGAIYTGFGFYVIYSIVLSSLAAAMTVYIAPGAAGSGIPELMGVLNGVKYPNIMTKKVLVVKVIGVILAVSGTLCVGKEGPLAHIGAIVAILCLEAPLPFLA